MEKVTILGIDKRRSEDDRGYYLYGVDAKGNLYRTVRGSKLREIMVPHACVREPGYLYYLDASGDICRAPRGYRRAKCPRCKRKRVVISYRTEDGRRNRMCQHCGYQPRGSELTWRVRSLGKARAYGYVEG
jgi:Zn ribbon nucleic-acid-binding protein